MIALLAWLLVAISTPAPVRVTVSPRVALAPSALHVKVVIERDVRNRALAIVVVGDHYAYEGIKPVEADQAQRVWDFWFDNLPCGDYVVQAAIVRTDGDDRAQDRAQLRGAACPELEAVP